MVIIIINQSHTKHQINRKDNQKKKLINRKTEKENIFYGSNNETKEKETQDKFEYSKTENLKKNQRFSLVDNGGWLVGWLA